MEHVLTFVIVLSTKKNGPVDVVAVWSTSKENRSETISFYTNLEIAKCRYIDFTST